MSTTNDAGATLLARQEQLEQAFANLQPAVLAEVKQATDEIKKILDNTVVNPGVVTAVSERMAALTARIQGFTSAVSDLYTPPAEDQTPVETQPPAPPVETTGAVGVGGTTPVTENPPPDGGNTPPVQ